MRKLFLANSARIGRFDGAPVCDAVPASMTEGSPDGLKADLEPVVLRDVGLQELVVRRLLDVDEVRDLDYFPDTTEMLADAEVGLDDARHRCS